MKWMSFDPLKLYEEDDLDEMIFTNWDDDCHEQQSSEPPYVFTYDAPDDTIDDEIFLGLPEGYIIDFDEIDKIEDDINSKDTRG